MNVNGTVKSHQSGHWRATVHFKVTAPKADHHLDGTGTVARGKLMLTIEGAEPKCSCANTGGRFAVRLPLILSCSLCVLLDNISLAGRP